MHFQMIENVKKRMRVASVTYNENFSTSHSRFIPTIKPIVAYAAADADSQNQ